MSTDQRSPFNLPNGNSLTESSIFCGVTIDSDGNAALPSAGGTIVGVMYGLDGTGGSISVRGFGDGLLKLKMGGTTNPGDQLKVTSAGAFVTASPGDVSVAACNEGGADGEIGNGVLFGAANAVAGNGTQSLTLGTDAPVAGKRVYFVSTTGTVTGALPNGAYDGEIISIVQAVATGTPVGTMTGAFADDTNAAKTTLALGTAVAKIGDFAWNGSHWRAIGALGGTGSGLS